MNFIVGRGCVDLVNEVYRNEYCRVGGDVEFGREKSNNNLICNSVKFSLLIRLLYSGLKIKRVGGRSPDTKTSR